MDEKDIAELNALLGMFEHPGWAVLERMTKDRIAAFQSAAPFNIKDADALNYFKGVMETLTFLLNLPAMAAQQAEELHEGEPARAASTR